MACSYVVSIYALRLVPRTARLEHVFLRADSAPEADALGRAAFLRNPDMRRFGIQMSHASEIPGERAAAPGQEPPGWESYVNPTAAPALPADEEQEGGEGGGAAGR